MSPMNNRLLRPWANLSTHPEALSWQSRVVSAGGTVTKTSLDAVSAFCRAIDAAGIRSKMYRTNLLAGGDLSAALVPVYIATALGGTQLGNSTDINSGFVTSEYAETGNAGGLHKSAATTKQLATGLTASNLPQFATAHLAVAMQPNSVTAGGFVFGGLSPTSGTDRHFIYASHSGGYVAMNAQLAASSGSVDYVNALAASGRYVWSRTSNTLITAYRNGSSVATNTAAANPTATTAQLYVFNQSFLIGRVYCYSLGDGLTASEASALDAAISAYLTAMGRV